MADDGDIVKFEDAVKAKIKNVLADLIPEDRWDFMVEKVTKEFIEKDLPEMVKAELRVKYAQAIKDVLSGSEWREKWDPVANNNYGASEMVKAIAVEAAPLIFEQVIASVIQSHIYGIRNQLDNMRR